jgi:hypothetical protein
MSNTNTNTNSHWLDGGDGVYVAGIGLHPYQFPSDTPYTHLGLTAVRGALADAGLDWKQVQSAYVGTTAHRHGRRPRDVAPPGFHRPSKSRRWRTPRPLAPLAFRLACMEVAQWRSATWCWPWASTSTAMAAAPPTRTASNATERRPPPCRLVKFALMARSYHARAAA